MSPTVKKSPLARQSLASYPKFLGALKSRIQVARLKASRSVCSELILLYWDIGRGILQKQQALGWGQAVIDRLSRDLQKSFPGVSGFSARNLRNMKQFAETYSVPQFWQQAVANLPSTSIWQQAVAKLKPSQFLQQVLAGVPWGQHLLILNKVTDPTASLYYLCATSQFAWSRNVLLNQINAKAYERTFKHKKSHNFALALPEHLSEQADEALKSSYNLEFLGIGRIVKERKLEDRLMTKLRDFVLELGYGFCFVGRQYRVTAGTKEYFIDLLFYHRFLKALVALELKVGGFEPEYVGKMDFYLNLLNARERAPGDNPSIGIILCAEKDDVVVEFSLKTKKNPIGVASYHLTDKLPRAFKGKLPSAAELRSVFLSDKES